MVHILGFSKTIGSLYFMDDTNEGYVRDYRLLNCVANLSKIAYELNNSGNLVKEWDLGTVDSPWFPNMKEIVVQFDKEIFVMICSESQYEKYIKSEIRKSCLKYTKNKLLGTFDEYNMLIGLVCDIAKNADKDNLKLKSCDKKRQSVLGGVTYDVCIYYLKDLEYLINNVPNNETMYLKRLIDSRHSQDCYLKPIYDTERQCLYSVDDYFRELLSTTDGLYHAHTVASIFYNEDNKTLKIIGNTGVDGDNVYRPFVMLNIETLETERRLVQVESFENYLGVKDINELLDGVNIYSGSDKMGLHDSICEKIY